MFRSPETNVPSSRTVLSVAASVTLSALALRLFDKIPDAVECYLLSRLRVLSTRLSSRLTAVIKDSDGLAPNRMFEAAHLYLGTKLSPSTKRVDVHKPLQEEELVVRMDTDQELVDSFMGAELRWVLMSSTNENSASESKVSRDRGASKAETKYFELSFRKRHREMVLKSYLPWILSKEKEIKEGRKMVKLHTVDYNGPDYWGSINLNHPANFDTMAMDPEMKAALMEDLDQFVARREYYKRVGRAWKRGYLLYGPPGTGKSSLVAAMANYLKYDVYDLDLSEVQCNSDLRRLLIGTGNRSIIVIEDIDCSKESKTLDEEKITLSGLLNFIDGLWSCCGDERIIVFTTNHRDRLDPALLRPGRMDLHIHMSYCSFSGFKTLASNYLGIQDQPLFKEVEELLKVVQATPAEVAGELMKTKYPDIALQGLIKFLCCKRDEIP
ncbi:AAA-ATPase At3g50940-like [Syzygium oleosum]|uniref:AAA-ATPase At3g50940-like n=1 Tax=Syzygium oleosum TaxID=219896 RepID=UPI0024B9F546|nr:AAA-ATPase At3g50940-like [Syzygium oleosum]